MTANAETQRARRYLLGQASEEEAAAIELEYFEQDAAIDRIAAVEDDLIEDYLAGRLPASERARFEQDYLASPQHRIRVETIRELMARAPAQARVDAKVVPFASRRMPRYGTLLALAASLVIVASGVVWMYGPFGGRRPESPAVAVTEAPSRAPGTTAGPTPAPTPVPTARIFALTLSPVAVRGAADSPAVVVPAGTDVIAIDFERDGDAGALRATRATVRTVDGREVWQGAAAPGDRPSASIARIEVPAAALPADDYLVTVFGVDSTVVEREWTQYFLRLRRE